MFIHINGVASAVLMVILLFGLGLAAEGTKAPPVTTAVTAVEQQKTPVSSVVAAEPATGEQINWQVISSGGTKGTSTSFILQGTVAQAVVGSGSSTNFGLRHGYWQAFGAAGGCCNGDGKRGNVDNLVGPAGEIDVADLTYLVAYLFQGGPVPACIDEGNVDGLTGPAGDIDVADLTYLVSYLFQGGPAPAACP